jgi:hypothetical protein
MSGQIPEADWRVFRGLHPIWIERFCKCVNDELLRVLSDDSRDAYERYLAAYKLMHKRDKEIASAFSSCSRHWLPLQIPYQKRSAAEVLWIKFRENRLTGANTARRHPSFANLRASEAPSAGPTPTITDTSGVKEFIRENVRPTFLSSDRRFYRRFRMENNPARSPL